MVLISLRSTVSSSTAVAAGVEGANSHHHQAKNTFESCWPIVCWGSDTPKHPVLFCKYQDNVGRMQFPA